VGLERRSRSDVHYERVFDANVRGPVLCMAEFARRVGHASGRIVNISSGQARTAMPGAGMYAGSKGAIEATTRVFAADLGPHGITVNAIAPGATATKQFLAAVPEQVQQETVQNTALGRLGQPEDIADAVAFLLSDDAHWVTGQVLDVNGGLRRS
jgi:3-oxoacyl-[acyl-carrier protein] reductase